VRYDATGAEVLVYTYREGLLSAIGHDLCLRVTRFSVEIGADDAITAELDAGSLRATGAISQGDARKIEGNAAHDVLSARRYPTIQFASTRVVRDGERARVEGELTLHGVKRPLAFDAFADGEAWRADVRLDQRDFGIKPYTAMLGALRVRADVLVRLKVPRA
jgi:polyisoprenoid-binding protein YceI